MKGATVKPYSSAREDRDYLLEYKSIDLASLERVDLLDVPVDNVNRDEAVARIMDMVERKEGPHFVFFADPVKLMQVRPGKKLSFIARDSDSQIAVAIDQSGHGLGQLLFDETAHRHDLAAHALEVRIKAARNMVRQIGGFHVRYLHGSNDTSGPVIHGCRN